MLFFVLLVVTVNEKPVTLTNPLLPFQRTHAHAQVGKSATAQEIKKAYFRLSKQHHPDKGGADHTFQEISAAYQVLSDEAQRKKYDLFGLKGLQPDATTADFFDAFSRRRSASVSSNRSEDVNHTLSLTLEDLYNGKTFKMAVTRTTTVGTTSLCEPCHGRGAVLQMRRLDNGLVQQAKRHCPSCQGTGSHAMRQKERKIVQVKVEKGMRDGDKIVFAGLGDEPPHKEAGNLNFIVKEQQHQVFKRKGADLLVRKTLTLNEALTGFSFAITHLDQRKVIVKSKPGEIVAPLEGAKGFVKMIPNEGMPSRGNPFMRGNLYVHFTVQFPKEGELSPEVLDALRRLLPGRPPELDETEAADIVHMTPTDMRNFGKGGMTYSNDGSDTDDSVPEGVQCQQS